MTDVRLRVGGHTDVGRLRDKNQDSILLGPVVFGVADGMGGHQGGEVASALAVRAVTDNLTDGERPTISSLRRAVEQANRVVFERSGTDPAVAGMGTTLVAIALVDDADGVHLAIVNVGDSRAYRLTDDGLVQITDDHSLVGELVRDGRITAEEAEVHPQRNIVTRALGIEPRVAVDDFHLGATDGDRYVLCSDGLTNEVPEVEIAAVLRQLADPDEAAAELVRLANENGGRDNITVVVVDVEGDGPEPGPGVVPDAENFSHHPDGDTDAYTPVPDTSDSDEDTIALAAADLAPADDRLPRRERRRDRPRAVTLRSIAFVLVVLVLVGGGIFLVNDYATNTYHVTIADDQVVIMKGRPGGFLWIDPSLVEETDIAAEDVLPADRDDLDEGVAHSSLDRARRYVANLEERIAETTPPVTTTTTTTSAPSAAPQDGVGSATTDGTAGG